MNEEAKRARHLEVIQGGASDVPPAPASQVRRKQTKESKRNLLGPSCIGRVECDRPCRHRIVETNLCANTIAKTGERTLEQVSLFFDKTRERIRQIEQSALRKLRRRAPLIAAILEHRDGSNQDRSVL